MTTVKPLDGHSLIEVVGPDAPEALSLAIGMTGRMARDLGAAVTRITARSNAPIDKAADFFLNTGKTCLSAPKDSFDTFVERSLDAADCMVLDAGSLTRLPTAQDAGICVSIGMTSEDAMGGSEFTIEAQSGLLDLIGEPEAAPLRLGGHQTAYSAGLAAYVALVSALPKHAAGQRVAPLHVNLLDVAVWLNWKTLAVVSRSGATPTRQGALGDWTALPCKDGYFAAVYRAVDWAAIKAALDDPRLEDTRFDTPGGRRQHRAELNTILIELFKDFSRADIHAFSLKHRLPLGPVWTPAELAESEHLRQRNFLSERAFDGKTVPFPTLPVRWNGAIFQPGTPVS